jgi:outer membrane protein OmpA-like peptidoglycan-associated protein
MVMAQAAQQVMNANQAAGMAQSPEQQLVALEQAKVELEKQKLQQDTIIQAAEMELKEKQLELDENEQIIDMLKTGSSTEFKKEKAKLDRESKKELKSMDVLGKLAVEEEKQNAEDSRTAERNLKDIMEKGED